MPDNHLQDSLFRSLFDLTGQVAVVTGGLGRLGREYVRTLWRAGAAVAALDVGENAVAFDSGERVLVQRVDLTVRADVHAALARIARELGTPTILVNNAGMGSSPADAGLENGPFEDYPETAWDAMIDSHLKTTLLVSQAFVKHYRAGKAVAGPPSRDARFGETGSIINVSSTYGVVSPDQSIYAYKRTGGVEFYKPVGYSVAKSGVLNFTRWLAEYGAPLGIRVNTLVPGGVREAAHAPEFVAEYEKRTPLGRMATESDYNGAVLFLASKASAYMTGATLVVDGGWTAK